MRYRDLQALVYKQETQKLTLHSVVPRALLNFLFLVCKLVLVNPDNARTKSAVILDYLISNLTSNNFYRLRVKVEGIVKFT